MKHRMILAALLFAVLFTVLLSACSFVPEEIRALVNKIVTTKFFIVNGAQLVSLKMAIIRTVDDEAIV